MTTQQAIFAAQEQHQAGRLREAEAIYRQILAVEPNNPDALHLLGVLAYQIGRLDTAAELISRAISAYPGAALFHCSLGQVVASQGRLQDAVSIYLRALALKPDYPEALNNLGAAQLQLGKLDEAATTFRKAIEIHPDYPQAHINLGSVLHMRGMVGEAIGEFRQALRLLPQQPEAHSNLGNALVANGEFAEAIASYQQAILLRPDDPQLLNNLGAAYHEMGREEEAAAALEKAMALRPDYSEAHSNLGSALQEMGQIEDAIKEFRRALKINPALRPVQSSLLAALQHDPQLDARTIFQEHRQWAAGLTSSIQKTAKAGNIRPAAERLRIGYISPDMREHSVSFFLEPLLEYHDPTQVEVFCYPALSKPDSVSMRLQKHAAHWKPITHMADEQAASLIQQDQIDILVDLAGHTAGNRLPIFARKPAPIQVTYLGYPNTTGLETIDYRMTDAFADPPGMTEQFHSEKLYRLPDCFLCYRPPEAARIDLSPLPSKAAGQITFGCFNALPKLNHPLIELWSRILEQVPRSRLLLKNSGLGIARARQILLDHFAANGIGPERLELRGKIASRAEHLSLYNQIDIALDSYPYHGATTTCEAMWMGVPVVSLAGPTHLSRVGVSLLNNVGLTEFIAQSPEEYVSIAVARAQNLTTLARIRSELREKMKSSPLMDATRFARNVEAAYRTMWQRWCNSATDVKAGR